MQFLPAAIAAASADASAARRAALVAALPPRPRPGSAHDGSPCGAQFYLVHLATADTVCLAACGRAVRMWQGPPRRPRERSCAATTAVCCQRVAGRPERRAVIGDCAALGLG